MGNLKTKQDEAGLCHVLDEKPVEAGARLEVCTFWGWRKGSFVPGDRPSLRMEDSQIFPIDPTDPIRWPEK